MCGIIGIFGDDPDVVKKASLLLEHRGPDDHGLFVDKFFGIGLGHTRLSILDTSSHGHQPMLSKDGKVVLVFNGEIYNFRELRDTLKEKNYKFDGESDSEVLLCLYLLEGKDFLSKLNGIFALAIWDSRDKSLFIARDGLGVKPLYYAASNNSFSFSSEIKALLQLSSIEKKIDEESINRYLSFLWCPGKGTPIKSVCKLLPGEAMIIKDGIVKNRWIWYQLPVFTGILPDLCKKKSLSGVTEYLRQAVHRQMVSDVPLGAFLSGGLDSSSIVAFAREMNPDLRCFTIDIIGKQDKGVINDLPYAQKVAKHLNVPLDVVSVDSNKIAQNLEYMVAQLDEPLADPAALNVFYISQLARKQGIKVLLSGVGGDDLFTGYRRHHALQLQKYWSWIPQGIRVGIEREAKKLSVSNPFQRKLTKFLNGAGLEGIDRLVNYFRWADDSLLRTLYSKEFIDNLGQSSAEDPMVDFIMPIIHNRTPLEQMLALEQRFFLADHNLNYTDKMSMAAGVEVRVPFLDIDLVNFSARIPNKYKQKGSTGKWVLKKAMEPYLPKEVIYRPKTGFGVPLRRWMQYELREMLGDLLSAESLQRRGLFEPTAVQRLIAVNDSGKVDASYTLLSLLCIEIWCRTYLD